MSHIYWELHEIPRPSDSYINHSDGRVFLMSEDGLGKKKRKVTGHALSPVASKNTIFFLCVTGLVEIYV